MSIEMDWSHDYCLYCDKQTAQGVYCSQSCRLADLEKAGASEPTSPSYVLGVRYSSSWRLTPTNGNSVSHFQLPPAVNFNALRSNSESHHYLPASPQTAQHAKQSYISSSSSMSSRSSDSPHQQRSLNASSSRSSLSSISSSNTAQGLSNQALSQLRGYSNSFDQVRDWKRRVTVG